MARRKPQKRPETPSSGFEQARDELFSHILRCGVLEATPEHQKDWFDDTMEYLADRYETLSDDELAHVRRLGEQYCRPVIRNSDAVPASK
jgi:hypothetical protein